VVSRPEPGSREAALSVLPRVTRAHINAAKVLIALDRKHGRRTSEFVKAIAEAGQDAERMVHGDR
jgi:hypothetical protein